MKCETMVDHGQSLAPPQGKVIGYFDNRADFKGFTAAARGAGFAASQITSLFGEDGVHLLERLKEASFFFSDSEDSIIQLSMRELKPGHFALAVDVVDHEQAELIVRLAKPHHGHTFHYFGTWVSEQLSR